MSVLPQAESINGVVMLSPISADFEGEYLAARKKENRVLNDREVGLLPVVSEGSDHFHEWKLRQASTNSVLNYLQNGNFTSALDIGCGNGWFTNKLASVSTEVLGMDLNQTELEQAARVFGRKSVQFCYGDVFSAELPKNHFDFITLNACFQYFPNAEKLISRLFELLTPSGEIHIIDSPFYQTSEVDSARKRTHDYFTELGFPKMAKHYFHHDWNKLKPFKFELLHDSNSIKTRVSRRFGIASSPFPWIVIRP